MGPLFAVAFFDREDLFVACFLVVPVGLAVLTVIFQLCLMAWVAIKGRPPERIGAMGLSWRTVWYDPFEEFEEQ
jgi:hypothetical protein